MTTKIIRCAIYTRKSSEEGLEQDFNSLHAQREASEAYIKSQKHEGWQLVKTTYDDGGYSGGTMNRPALQLLMQDIQAGKIDVIVVYKVDRLSRSLHDFAKMVEVFDKRGVSFVSVTQQFNTTSSMGRLTLNVLLSFAQFEREVTGERIRDKIAASKKKGMWMGGYAPLGYDIVEKKLLINPAEAEIIRHIFTRYLEVGGVRLLCYDLRANGIYSKARDSDSRPGGMPFSRGALYHLLSNPLYVGQIRFKGTCHAGQHEGIIDPQLWDQVQQKLASNRAGIVEQSRKTEAGSLNGKLFDAATGETLVVVHVNKKGRRYRYYISQSLKTGTKGDAPNGWRLPGKAIEATIFGIAQAMLNDRDALVDALQTANIPSHNIPSLLTKAHDAAQYQGHVFGQFLRRVELRQDGVQVQLSLASLVSPEAGREDISIISDAPMQIKRRGYEMRLVIEGGMAAAGTIDSTLVNAIARAHAWSEALLSGRIATMAEIASRNNVSDSYVKKIMPLAFLAPDIVEAIMAGKQPAHLTTQMLIRQIDIPFDWQDQRRVLGFSA
jgi:site-specific DNA recombinase